MQEYYIPKITITAEKDNHRLKQFTIYKKYIGTDVNHLIPFEGFKEITLAEEENNGANK